MGDSLLCVMRADWTMALLDLQGRVVNDFVYTYITPLLYPVLDADGDWVRRETGLYAYCTASDHYGLSDGTTGHHSSCLYRSGGPQCRCAAGLNGQCEVEHRPQREALVANKNPQPR